MCIACQPPPSSRGAGASSEGLLFIGSVLAESEMVGT